MKVVLPLGALGILATVVAWPSLVDTQGVRGAVDAGESELVRPRFYSVDESGQPFSMTAESAHEPDGDAGLVDLVAPSAEMTEKDGSWVTLSSRTGTFDRHTDILHMVEDVHIIRDDGTEYTTSDAYANVKNGEAWGDARVVGQGPQGEINAEGFRLTDRGRTIVFVNQSSANLSSDGGKGTESSGRGGTAEPSAPGGTAASDDAAPPTMTAPLSASPAQPAPVPPTPAQPAGMVAVPEPGPASVAALPVAANGPSQPSPEPARRPEPTANAESSPGMATTPASSLLQRPPPMPPPPKPGVGASVPRFVPPPPRRKPASR